MTEQLACGSSSCRNCGKMTGNNQMKCANCGELWHKKAGADPLLATEHPIDALKPCPFCLGPAVNVGGDYITCGAAWEPGCAGHMVRTDAETWNTRAFRPDPIKVAKLTSLEASGLLPSTPAEHPTDAMCDEALRVWNEQVSLGRSHGNEIWKLIYLAMEAAKPSTPIDDEGLVEKVALATLTERYGERPATYCRDNHTSAWRDEKRAARAAIEAINVS